MRLAVLCTASQISHKGSADILGELDAIRERGGLPVAAVALDLLDMGRLLGSERLQRAARDAIRRIESPA